MEILSADIKFNAIDTILTPECKNKKIYVDYEFSEPWTPKDIACLSVYINGKLTFERGIRLTSNDFVYQVRQRWINVRDFDRFKRTIVDDLFAKGFLSALANSDAMKRDRRN